jgi:hypothetical protein
MIKKFEEFVNENLINEKIGSHPNIKDVVVLAERDLPKKLSEYSKEEFVEMFMEDLESSKAPYRKYTDTRAGKRYDDDKAKFALQRERDIKDIIDKSYGKYKREANRKQWADREIAKLPAELKKEPYFHEGKDFDGVRFKTEPWSNSSGHGISIGGKYGSIESARRDLEYLYDESVKKKNKYFLNCTGWDIIICNWGSTLGEEVRLHLSDELQAQWDKDEEDLYNDIMRFYATCRYCGD